MNEGVRHHEWQTEGRHTADGIRRAVPRSKAFKFQNNHRRGVSRLAENSFACNVNWRVSTNKDKNKDNSQFHAVEMYPKCAFTIS